MRAVLAGATMVAVFAVLSPSTVTASVRVSAVDVVRCPTQFGVPGPVRRTPATVNITSSSSTRVLVAYTNTASYLVGPRGMRCSGGVGADSTSLIVVWPRGQARPGIHARTDGLTLLLDPACVGCQAGDACPFFRALARRLGFPCTSGIAAGERVSRPAPTLALFEDPPGVAGSGWPSGGPDPANGVVGSTGIASDVLVYRSTCTLPAREHGICTTSLNDVIRRYG
jgi:hypothetical protein